MKSTSIFTNIKYPIVCGCRLYEIGVPGASASAFILTFISVAFIKL